MSSNGLQESPRNRNHGAQKLVTKEFSHNLGLDWGLKPPLQMESTRVSSVRGAKWSSAEPVLPLPVVSETPCGPVNFFLKNRLWFCGKPSSPHSLIPFWKLTLLGTWGRLMNNTVSLPEISPWHQDVNSGGGRTDRRWGEGGRFGRPNTPAVGHRSYLLLGSSLSPLGRTVHPRPHPRCVYFTSLTWETSGDSQPKV